MNLSIDQVLALAPDASAIAAAKKLGTPKPWRGLGKNARAIWGECQGSALYQVRVDLGDLATKCTCPSRKFPCKHALGLLLLAASNANAVAESTAPAWIDEWLEKRQATATRRETRAAEDATPDPAAQAKRAEARRAKVVKGLDALDLWMNDRVRHGLASIETKRPSFWEEQAARLVDAQAPALAGRIRRIGALVGASTEWPERVLFELGKVALLTHAFRRIDALPAPLQADVRHLIGWTTTEADVEREGEAIEDEWLVLGVLLDDDERVRVRRTWLRGVRTGRTALVLDFAAGNAPFGEAFVPWSVFTARAHFWPSAAPLRALVRDRKGTRPFAGDAASIAIDALLREYARAVASQPWTDRFAAALGGVAAVRDGSSVSLCDEGGAALPLVQGDHARLLAISGGHPATVSGEWDGRAFRPFGIAADGAFVALASEGS